MKLNDFERYVDKVVVARGLQYYREQRVESVEEQEKYLYVATVAGNDDYAVEVQLNAQGEILAAECNCPYIDGPYCKHMVAVFLALRQEDTQDATGETCDSKKTDKKGLPVKSDFRNLLKEELSRQSKEKLIHFLLSLVEDNSIIADQIMAEFSSGNGEKEKWIRLMKRYIEQAEDENSFISYRNCRHAVEGAYKVLERVQTAVENGEYEFAVDLALCVMGEMVDMLQFADDSAGDVGMVIDEVRDVLTVIVSEASPDTMTEICFLKILSAASQQRYNGWSDCRIDLLYLCAELSRNARQREQLEQYLQRISPTMTNNETNRSPFLNDYEAEAIILLRYELIKKFDKKKAAENFLWEHRCFSRCRELALQGAMAAKDYDTAEKLALEGEEHDKNFAGLVKKWKERRFEIYQLEKQLDKMRTVSRELALSGEFTYYQKLKALYDATEWAQIYPDILAAFAKQSGYMRNIYTDVIVEEKEWGKLLVYVQQNPYRVLDFYQQLLADYREQVYEIFSGLILREAAHSNKRSDYQRVCSHLRLLVKIGGSNIVIELVKQLTFEYMRRPAFHEELQKVKVK